METIIYVRLMNEGAQAFRPVAATQVEEKVFRLEGHEIHNPDDEDWEFLPGTKVLVEERMLDRVSKKPQLRKVAVRAILEPK